MKMTQITFMLTFLLAATLARTEEINVDSLQDNFIIFSGILEDSLELNQSTGLFGMQLGGVESTYLRGQGVLFAIKSPLANKRNSVGLASLSSALQSMQSRPNPFQSRSSTTAQASLAQNSLETAEASSVYEDMMDRIANVDYSLAVNSAIQQASEAARSLRNLGSVDSPEYAAMEEKIELLRTQSQEKIAELREFSQSLKDEDQATEGMAINLRDQFDQLAAALEPLKEEAVAIAKDLNTKSELAKEEFTAQLSADISSFEVNVFSALCTYGATLKQLPSNEHISIQLMGLGGDTSNSEKRDKLFVLEKTELMRCESGEIGAEDLMRNAISYSY